MAPPRCPRQLRQGPSVVAAVAALTALLATPPVAAAAPCFDALSLGGFHGLATASNTTRGFGEAAAGQIDVPPSLAGSVRAAAAGGFFSCALHTTGVSCWGAGGSGATTVPSSIASDGGVRALAAGGYHACAILANASAVCWGANGAGQVSPLPPAVSTSGVASLALGAYHSCAVLAGSGVVTCWGRDDAGQVSGVPAALVSGASPSTSCSCGGSHCCCWGPSTPLTCWGGNSAGQTSVPPAVSTVTDACAGGYFSCAVVSGSVTCWGSSTEGETTVPPSASDGSVTSIACGWYGACALKSGGSFVCWGSSLAAAAAAALGSTSLDLSTAAVTSAGTASGTVFISSGAASAAAASSGALSFVTGDAAAGSSGPVVLATGAAPAGARGAISLLAPRVEIPGALTGSQLAVSNITARNLTVGSTALSEEDLIGLLAMLRQPCPSVTPSASVTPSGSAAPTNTPSGTPSPTLSRSPTASATPSTSATPTTSTTPSVSGSASPSASNSASPSASPSASSIPVWLVSTIAGSSTIAHTDGQGSAAAFSYPSGVAVDSSGYIYVADSENHCIRVIQTGFMVSTFAGAGGQGFQDGQGGSAAFNTPFGVASTGGGTLYVADTLNNAIRKVAPDAMVTTLAGSGSIGSADGQGAAASFYYPYGVAVDGAGTVYVADSQNNLIRKITSDGYVTTLAGSSAGAFADGQSTSASFNFPRGLTVDASGAVFVADTGNHRIRVIDTSGTVSTLAGSGNPTFAEGQGSGASFAYPSGLVMSPSGELYVADNANNRIRRVSLGGLVGTLAGTGSAGSADGEATATASFNAPWGIALDSYGVLYVADYYSTRIRQISRVA